MRAGRLRHRVAFLEKSATRSSTGAEVVTWSAFASDIPAEAQPLSGREFIAMRQAQSDISIRFRARYLAGVNAAMRVRWNGADYDVREVIDRDARGRELEILCTGAAGDV